MLESEKTTIHDVNAWMRIDFSGSSLSNPTYQSKNLYLNDSVLETAIITDTISQVNPLCFYYCQTLKKVVLPPTVKKIGNGASTDQVLKRFHCPKPSPLLKIMPSSTAV